jgi:P27 family predicted phage terminase small subunit
MSDSKKSATVHVLDGGEGSPPEPNWVEIYGDENKDRLKRAREHWRQIVSRLKDAGAIEPGNGHAIMRLVSQYLIFDGCLRNVAERGAVLPKTRKADERTNPHFRTMRQCDETIRQLEAELGIAPVRRDRVGKVARKVTKARPADAFLGKPVNA